MTKHYSQHWSDNLCIEVGVCVCVYYVPVKVIVGCFFYCSIFIVYIFIVYVSIRDVFAISVFWFNLVFHKMGMHELICGNYTKDVFNWYFSFNAEWTRNSHLLSKISFNWDMPSFQNLYYIGIDYWLLYACLTIQVC